MNTNIKRGIVTGAISLSLLGGTAATVAAAPAQGGGAETVMAAPQNANVGQLVRGLINVNIGAVQADVDVDNVLNDFTLVNVEDVLNDNNVEILNNVLNNSPILNENNIVIRDLVEVNNNDIDALIAIGILDGGDLILFTTEEN